MNMKEDFTEYFALNRTEVLGDHVSKGRLDLLNLFIIGLSGEVPDLSSPGDARYRLHRLLRILFSPVLSKTQKFEVLRREYGIAPEHYDAETIDSFKKEVDTMCNLSQGVKEYGIKIGREEGLAEGYSSGRTETLTNTILRSFQLGFSLENISFPEYLAQRTVYFSERRTKAPDTVFSGRHHSGTVSILSSDSILNRYAYNMTMASYIANPAIGRESEISDLELILISPKKSPILLGEAGVGKTAVVEGLAWLLQQGNVPKLLQHKELYKLTTTSLLSGTKYVGEMEERIRQLMDELEKHPDIILFIDEIHTIVGAGSTESSNNDISNMLKPYIDRGDIKIIGSTTSDEDRKYLLSDKALARRFYPITIEEPDEDTTLRILLGTIPSIEYETKVRNAFSEEETRHILQILISLSAEKYQSADKRTRRPELPLTLLEMAFSYAALYSRDTVSIEDFICAVRHSNLLKQDVKANWQNILIK